MSQQTVSFEIFTSSTPIEAVSIEQPPHFDLQSRREVPASLAQFRKPRTKLARNNTTEKDNSNPRRSSFVDKAAFSQIATTDNCELDSSISQTNKSGLKASVSFGNKIRHSISSESASLATYQNDITTQEHPIERALRRRSSLPTLAICATSKAASISSRRSNFKSEENPRRPSWSSFWEHEFDMAESQSRELRPQTIQTTVHPDQHDSQRTHKHHPGHAVVNNTSAGPVREPTVDEKSSKKTTQTIIEKVTILLKRGLRKHLPTQTKSVETLQKAEEESEDETADSIYSLDLGPEISQDKSEIAYLCRIREEAMLDHQKHHLFGQRYSASCTDF